MIHVVLCDDHAVLRRGIRDTLTEAPDILVTGEAGGYSELREVLRAAPCDVLLLDLNMPGRSGLEVLASVRETHSAIKVLVCWRRLNSDPPCRSNIDPGRIAEFGISNCG